MGITQLFSDFANWGTVVGLPHIANAKKTRWRLFWWVVFLILLGVFCYELYIMISTLLSYPSAVATEIRYEEQRFPVVTICNQNPYKKGLIMAGNISAFSAMSTMLTTFHKAAVQSLSSVDAYGFQAVQGDDYLLQWRGTTWLSMLAAQIPPATLQPAMYSFDDLIAECTFNGVNCDQTSFSTFFDPIYGACYSFNNDPNLNYSTSRAGMKYGLKLLLTVKQTLASATSAPQDYLPTTWLAGARLYVGSTGDYPQLFGAGMNLAVGYQAVVALSPSQTVRAPPPCGQCNDNGGKVNYYTDYSYTMETCFDSCRQQITQDKCGCSNPRYPKDPGNAYCTSNANVDCMLTLVGDQASPTAPFPDLSATCGCTPPCSENNYGTTISLASFPSNGYSVSTGNPANPPCDGISSPFASNVSACRQWYQANSVQLIVYFADLKYELYTEDCSYGISDLINDLGGHAGLWLGLSVISVVECLGLVVLIFCYCCSGGKFNLRPSETEFSKDERIRDLNDVDHELDQMDQHHADLRQRYTDKK